MPPVTLSRLYDSKKIGTLIISYYRTGSHFLHDTIVGLVPDTVGHNETCSDDTLDQIESITASPGQSYHIAILNPVVPKFYLLTRPDILEKWHVVALTRKDKVGHFLSHFFWSCNTNDEKGLNTGKFKHHGTDPSAYENFQPQTQDIPSIIVWLSEQLINKYIPCDYSIDYDDLKNLDSDIVWNPNRTDSIKLENVLTNGKEVQLFLQNFKDLP